MYACLFLIILGIVSVQGAQPEDKQEKSMNPNAKRFYEPGMRVRGYSFHDHFLLSGFSLSTKPEAWKSKPKFVIT